MAEPGGLAPGVEEILEAGQEGGDEKKRSRGALVLVLLLLLLLCFVATIVDVWVERSPEERSFVTRNLECLYCHTELIPEMSKAAVHNPFLREECTTCHSEHGEEVTERRSGGGWKRWSQITTLLEWLPLRIACEIFEGAPWLTGEGDGADGAVVSVTEDKGADSELALAKTELCWICHGDLAASLGKEHRHSPFERGFCTDCHDPHASDYRVLLKRDERDLCSSCHPIFDELVLDQVHPPFEGRFCTNCHDPHASEWRGILVDNQRDLCFTCHPSVAPLSLKPVQHNPFYYDNCTGCHEPHASNNLPLLIVEQPPLCYMCHPGIRYDFLKPSHHPVGTLILNCADCHNPHAADYSALLEARDNALCYSCHSVPIEATYEPSAHQGQLCIRCHTPHGSAYEPILRQANPDICLQCHGWVEGLNTHPFRPVFYDAAAAEPLTCTSTCHDPHGTEYNYMLVDFFYPQDGLCLQCHSRVGIDF